MSTFFIIHADIAHLITRRKTKTTYINVIKQCINKCINNRQKTVINPATDVCIFVTHIIA